MNVIDNIKASSIPDIDKLVKIFEHQTEVYVQQQETEIELARALKDHENEVKLHIKICVMKHACAILKDDFFAITGRSVDHDQS